MISWLISIVIGIVFLFAMFILIALFFRFVDYLDQLYTSRGSSGVVFKIGEIINYAIAVGGTIILIVMFTIAAHRLIYGQ